MEFLPFLFLALAFASCWQNRVPKAWSVFAGLSVLSALVLGNITSYGVLILLFWFGCLHLYRTVQTKAYQWALFTMIVALSYGFKFHLFGQFLPLQLTDNFYLGIESPWIGLLPLAYFVPRMLGYQEFIRALASGFWLSCTGIFMMMILATSSTTVSFEAHLPSFALVRYLNNLFLVAIPEEAFYRGFVQNKLQSLFSQNRRGAALSLIITALLFMLAHVYWSPSLAMLGYTFLAGLLYGGVYLYSGKIESAILCHFLLNFVHMTFFSYHAM